MISNTMTVVGNLTRDAEARSFGTGNVTKLRLATNKRVKNQNGGWEDGAATYIDVAAWRKLGNAASVLRKGQKVIVTGELKGREYERADGTKVYAYEIDADTIGTVLMANDDAPKSAVVVEPDMDSPWE